ncbi:hypothetical protein OS21_41460 [Dickeya oryzae]
MTDHPIPDTAEKTVAEREAEARERARAARESQTPAHNTPPGQPDVTRFKKTRQSPNAAGQPAQSGGADAAGMEWGSLFWHSQTQR